MSDASHWETRYTEALQELEKSNGCNVALLKAFLSINQSHVSADSLKRHALTSFQKCLSQRMSEIEAELQSVQEQSDVALRPAKHAFRQAQGNFPYDYLVCT